MIDQNKELQAEIIELSKEALIDDVRFIDTEDLTEVEVGDPLKFHGRQPREIMAEAKTAIIFATYIAKFVTKSDDDHGRMSRLVLSGYYANIVKPLIAIKNYLETKGYKAKIIDGEIEDGIPLKGAAVKAGMGWIGKQSLLMHKKYGTFVALGCILTDADIGEQYDILESMCDGCHRCMDACPVQAIETPKILNKKKCLSHIMDEYNSDEMIPPDADSQGYFFECDICQNACAWNQRHVKKPLSTPFGDLFDGISMDGLFTLEHLKSLNEDSYEEELVPLMIGYQLPFEAFQRNLEHVEKMYEKG